MKTCRSGDRFPPPTISRAGLSYGKTPNSHKDNYMRRNIMLAAALALTIPGALLAQRDRSDRSSRRSSRESDDRDWLERCRDRDNDWSERARSKFCEERTMGGR